MGRRWTEAELKLMKDTSLTLAEIAVRLGRTEASIWQKSYKLGGDRRRTGERRGGKGSPEARKGEPGWQSWELELLADPSPSLVEIAELTGRTYSAIRHMASRRGHVAIRDYHLTGPAHPHWTGGPQMSMVWRGPDWPEVRAEAMGRDG